MNPSRIAALALLIAAAPAQARLVSFEVEKQAAYGRFEGVEFRRIEAKLAIEIEAVKIAAVELDVLHQRLYARCR